MVIGGLPGALPLRPRIYRFPASPSGQGRLTPAPVGFGSGGGAQVAFLRCLILRSGPDQFTTVFRDEEKVLLKKLI